MFDLRVLRETQAEVAGVDALTVGHTPSLSLSLKSHITCGGSQGNSSLKSFKSPLQLTYTRLDYFYFVSSSIPDYCYSCSKMKLHQTHSCKQPPPRRLTSLRTRLWRSLWRCYSRVSKPVLAKYDTIHDGQWYSLLAPCSQLTNIISNSAVPVILTRRSQLPQKPIYTSAIAISHSLDYGMCSPRDWFSGFMNETILFIVGASWVATGHAYAGVSWLHYRVLARLIFFTCSIFVTPWLSTVLVSHRSSASMTLRWGQRSCVLDTVITIVKFLAVSKSISYVSL